MASDQVLQCLPISIKKHVRRMWFNDIVCSSYLNIGTCNIVCAMVNCRNTVTMIRSTPLVLERFIVLYLFDGSIPINTVASVFFSYKYH